MQTLRDCPAGEAERPLLDVLQGEDASQPNVVKAILGADSDAVMNKKKEEGEKARKLCTEDPATVKETAALSHKCVKPPKKSPNPRHLKRAQAGKQFQASMRNVKKTAAHGHSHCQRARECIACLSRIGFIQFVPNIAYIVRATMLFPHQLFMIRKI
ncbi:unnamed protein product [Pieris macdunnoughi]|uniref:Uncharacterized protein n=1 Tax=Pieris macdunnoughi TaxID=345717 RepID=A0A821N1H9_9NEOP|nr:unnamed protein product [Pieris macdunnoughi]